MARIRDPFKCTDFDAEYLGLSMRYSASRASILPSYRMSGMGQKHAPSILSREQPLVGRGLCLRRRSRLNVVQRSGTAPGSISSLSEDEQARYGDLADVALNQKAELAPAPAGSRAHHDHEKLKQELVDTVEQLRRERNDAA